ncbi:hypothetical protein [Fischerella thermalis]|nr:hypothetical protein [Fischerella thermalis]
MSSWGERNYLQVYREFPRTQERSHISKMLCLLKLVQVTNSTELASTKFQGLWGD